MAVDGDKMFGHTPVEIFENVQKAVNEKMRGVFSTISYGKDEPEPGEAGLVFGITQYAAPLLSHLLAGAGDDEETRKDVTANIQTMLTLLKLSYLAGKHHSELIEQGKDLEEISTTMQQNLALVGDIQGSA